MSVLEVRMAAMGMLGPATGALFLLGMATEAQAVRIGGSALNQCRLTFPPLVQEEWHVQVRCVK